MGRGGAGQDGTPTSRFDQETTVPLTLKGIESNCLNVSSEARTNEILCKPKGEQNPRLMCLCTPKYAFGPKCASRISARVPRNAIQKDVAITMQKADPPTRGHLSEHLQALAYKKNAQDK